MPNSVASRTSCFHFLAMNLIAPSISSTDQGTQKVAKAVFKGLRQFISKQYKKVCVDKIQFQDSGCGPQTRWQNFKAAAKVALCCGGALGTPFIMAGLILSVGASHGGIPALVIVGLIIYGLPLVCTVLYKTGATACLSGCFSNGDSDYQDPRSYTCGSAHLCEHR